jgi:two-component system response regulator HydG
MIERIHNCRILIVDDEESIRVTFSMFLKRDGYQKVEVAASLAEALDIIKANIFDLIISDIVLASNSGIELLQAIRASGNQCPVVMITGFPNLETAAKAVRHGAFDYIAKPVNKETLLRFVRQALGHWLLQQEKEQLRRENEKFRRYLEVIFSSVRDAIITVDKELRIVHLNTTAKRWMTEMNSQAIVSLRELPGEMGKACFLDAGRIIKEGKEVQEHLVECESNNGLKRMISLNGAPIRDENVEFSGAVLVARDVTPGRNGEGGKPRTRFHGFIGQSKVMQDLYNLISNVGKVDTAVLITGESGTGKELACEALHAESHRHDRPLVKVDCGAISEELLESELFGHIKGAFTGADRIRGGRLLQADGGTLFLDEIGDISPRMQLRLLRFLQEKTFLPVGKDSYTRVDARVIAATNVDLKKKVQLGQFREDLYYRLKVVEIALPPLRKRPECIEPLVHHFIATFRDKLQRRVISISDQAMDALGHYHWPGNVRELRHVIERACVLCNGTTLMLDHFSADIVGSANAKAETAAAKHNFAPDLDVGQGVLRSEKSRILEALDATGGNKSKAAQLLGVDRTTLYRKLKKYHL